MMNLKVSELMETATFAVSTLGDASWILPATNNEEVILKCLQFHQSLVGSNKAEIKVLHPQGLVGVPK
jgi:hypothetical protein